MINVINVINVIHVIEQIEHRKHPCQKTPVAGTSRIQIRLSG